MNYVNQYVKVIAVLFVMLSTLLVGMTGVAMANTQQPAGSGTASDPYQVTNVEGLQWMINDRDAVYELQNNIDASDTQNWNNGAGFQPIGTLDTEFNGTLDLNGYAVQDLYINRGSETNVALLGYTEGVAVIDGLVDADVTGQDKVGILMSDAQVDSSNVGAFITNVSTSGTLDTTATDATGGAFGSAVYADADRSQFKNIYSTVDINSNSSFVSGISTEVYGAPEDLYVAGSIQNNNANALFDIQASVIDGYYDDSLPDDSKGTALTTSDMTGDATNSVTGFDYANTWELVQSSDDDATSDGYPILQSVDREAQLLAQDVTDPAVSNYNLEIGVLFNGSLQSNINYVIEDNQGSQVASGETVSDGPSTETLPEGDYTVSVATQSSEFSEESRTVSLTADSTESFDLQREQHNLTIETTFDGVSQSTINYVVEDSSGSQVASGETDVDGLATETLTQGDYTVRTATETGIFVEESRSVSLTADSTESFDLQREQHNLTIETVEGADSVDTNYRVYDTRADVVVSEGQTGSDGSVTVQAPSTDIEVTVADNDPIFVSQSSNVTTESDTTESFDLQREQYDLSVEVTDSDGNAVSTDVEVADFDGNTVIDQSTDSVTQTLDAGDYDINVAQSDSMYVGESASLTLDSTQTSSFDLAEQQYNLTILADSTSGNAVNTTYSVIDSNGNQQASGTTFSDGEAVVTLSEGDYNVTIGGEDVDYVGETNSVSLTSATTTSASLSEAQYDLTINLSDLDGNSIRTDYTVENSVGTSVASGENVSTVTVTLDPGEYTVNAAENNNSLVDAIETVTVDSDESVTVSIEDSSSSDDGSNDDSNDNDSGGGGIFDEDSGALPALITVFVVVMLGLYVYTYEEEERR